MRTTLATTLKWALFAAAAFFLVTGWVVLSRGGSITDDRTVVRIWDWWNPAAEPKLGEFFDKVERDFEAAHPDIDIRYQFIPFGTQYIQKLMSAFAAGNPPDAFQCSIVWATDLYDRGIIRDLDDFIAASPEVGPDEFLPISMQYISREGRVFGVPTSMDANALIFNAGMVREAGLDASPDAIDTWDTFLEYAEKLTIRDEREQVTRAGFLVSATGERFSAMLPWLATQGKSFATDDWRSTNVDTAENHAAMRFLYDLIHTYNVCFPPGTERQDANIFMEKKAAMMHGGTWDGYSLLEKAPDIDYMMAPFPRGPDGHSPATLTWVNMMMMPKNGAHPEETWEYLRYYGGLQVAKDMLVILLRNSPRIDLYDTPEWAEQVEKFPYLKQVPGICASGVQFPYKRFEEVNEAFRPYFQEALLGTMPIEEAMKEGNARVEKVLEGNWADRILRETAQDAAAREGGLD